LPESPDAAPQNCTRPVTYLTRGLGLAILVGCSFAAGACVSDGIDRDETIQRVVDEGRGAVSDEQAACYVDRVRDELGDGSLRTDRTPTPDQVARLASIRVDCMGIASLGEDGLAPATTPAVGVAGPQRRGDDPVLDGLWDQCAAGFGRACDDLFDAARLGSEYEMFGVTCGYRTSEERCAAVYPAPGVILPSAAQPSTTVPPLAP
jgi:hypothetical protein